MTYEQLAARYLHIHAENERLRRQVEFVKSENSADSTGCGIGFCMLCFCSHSKDEPHHADCPHNDANQ
jgi:hypothetical protein